MSDQVLSKHDLWALRINDYRNSGFTAREWCNQNNISLSTLRYWINKQNDVPNSIKEPSAPVFAELAFSQADPFLSAAPITIYLGTIRIEILETCHSELLSNLIGVLKYHA